MIALNPFEARCLEHDFAAAYVGLKKNAFDEEVKAGRLPAPVFAKRKPQVWDRFALDEAIDRKKKHTSLAEKARGLRQGSTHQVG